MKKHLLLFLSTFLLGLLLLVMTSLPVRADAAPPAQPPGADPETVQQTMVQMVNEKVVIEITDLGEPSDIYSTAGSTSAYVTALFNMVNQGQKSETMAVRFPLMNPAGMGDGYGNYPQISNFTVKINGILIPTSIQTSANPFDKYDPQAPSIPWAAFNVTFPPGDEVNMDVEYTLYPTGYLPIENYSYLLETGAGWYGEIGTGDVILRLPYPASSENVILNDPTLFFSDMGYFSGNDYIIHFENLEPTNENDIIFQIVSPFAWKKVVDAREELTKSKSADLLQANAELGKALQLVIGEGREIRTDPGSEILILEALNHFNQAIQLSPDNYDAHYGFASILSDLAYFRGEVFDESTIDRLKTEYAYLKNNFPQNKEQTNYPYLSFFDDVENNSLAKMIPNPDSKYSISAIALNPSPTLSSTEIQSSPTPEATASKQNPSLINIQCGKVPLTVLFIAFMFLQRKIKKS